MTDTDLQVEMGTCRQCESEIPTHVKACPECGYNPRKTLLILAGIILSLGVVALAIIPGASILMFPLGLIIGVAAFGAKPTQ